MDDVSVSDAQSVGPFYLSPALGLDVARVELVLSIGPLVTALTGVAAGRIADPLGAERAVVAGLGGMAVGCFVLSVLSATFGVFGYIGPSWASL
jgi:MFS family permease